MFFRKKFSTIEPELWGFFVLDNLNLGGGGFGLRGAIFFRLAVSKIHEPFVKTGGYLWYSEFLS